MHELAIVIPAYKAIFFDKALQSLANQTNKNFTIYIGDDNSPDNLKNIAAKYTKELDIHYTRFKTNIGAKHLVHQWNRCLQLVKDESWVWLFSDDDIADANCVETFYGTIKNDGENFDVYRFNTRVVDDKGDVFAEAKESPFIENAYDMAIAILNGERGNSMPDHIFSKAVYEEKGFVFTHYAQSADWATSILFSQDKGICTMQGAKVNWRLSEFNISGMASRKKAGMLKGYFQFLHWILKHFEYLRQDEQAKFEKLVTATEHNLKQLIQSHYKGLSLLNIADVYSYYQHIRHLPNSVLSVLKLYRNFYRR